MRATPNSLQAPNGLQGGEVGLAIFVRYLDDAAPAEKPRLLHMALQQAGADGTWAAAVHILAEHLRAVAFADHGGASGPASLEVDPLRSVTLGLLYLNDFIAAENLLSQHAALPEISALARFAANIDDGSIAASTQLASLALPASVGSVEASLDTRRKRQLVIPCRISRKPRIIFSSPNI